MRKVVQIDGKKFHLKQTDVLGSGGEATVIKVGTRAIKLYHTPNSSRGKKLIDFLALGMKMPPCVCAPLKLVYDSTGRQVIGFAMNRMSPRNEVVHSLASRSFRKKHPDCNSQFVTDLFLDGYKTTATLHQAGIVVGDYNDLNVAFDGTVMSFFDADSFQFGQHPCMVGTEDFLVPELYGKHLSSQPYFKPEYDWYSWFCMFFRSLLMTHPYGGFHPKYSSIPKRAIARVTVFDDGVKYPKVALTPDILNDDLSGLFERIFKRQERLVPDIDLFREYRESLIGCNSCGTWYPAERSNCPQCTTINTQQVQRQVRVIKSPGKMTVENEHLMTTTGNFVWMKTSHEIVYAVAVEAGEYILYIRNLKGTTHQRITLFRPKTNDTKFDIYDDQYLVISHDANSDDLWIIDFTAAPKPKGIKMLKVDAFDGERQFACLKNGILRLHNSVMYSTSMQYGQFLDNNINTFMDQQTRFDGQGHLAVGYERFFSDLSFFLYRFDRRETGERYNLQLPDFEPGETLIDIASYFHISSVMLMLKTEIKGKTYTRVIVVHQDDGNILSNYRVEALSSDTHRNIHGKVYVKPPGTLGIILHPTDDGVVQEQIGTNKIGKQVLLSETEPFISESDFLAQIGRGIIVMGDRSVNYLTLS